MQKRLHSFLKQPMRIEIDSLTEILQWFSMKYQLIAHCLAANQFIFNGHPFESARKFYMFIKSAKHFLIFLVP